MTAPSRKPNKSFFYDGANYNAALAFTAPHGGLYLKFELRLRVTDGVIKVMPGNWIIRTGAKFKKMTPAEYEEKYQIENIV